MLVKIKRGARQGKGKMKTKNKRVISIIKRKENTVIHKTGTPLNSRTSV